MSDSMKMLITNSKVYDFLKYLAQIVLPGVATLYFALSEIWGLPHGAEIVGTIVAFDAFLGVLLGINTAAYNKSEARFDGTMDVFEDEDTKTFSFNVNEDPYDLDKKDQITLRVNRQRDAA